MTHHTRHNLLSLRNLIHSDRAEAGVRGEGWEARCLKTAACIADGTGPVAFLFFIRRTLHILPHDGSYC